MKLTVGFLPLEVFAAGVVFHGPSPYLGFDDSPFKAQSFEYFYLQTFEGSSGNLPGVTLSPGWVINNPSSVADSVDIDDGVVDGMGTNGHSLFSGGSQSNLLISFDAAALGGHLPTHVGIVATDVGYMNGPFGIATVTLTATDTNGMSLGFLVATNFGDGLLAGATAEDRFFGVSCPVGIADVRLYLTNGGDWEVDHLQFGYAVPSVTQPTLQIEFAPPETIRLSWPTNLAGFLPQESDEQPGTNWTAVPEGVVVVGTNFQVTQTLVASKRFFRLRHP